MTKVAASKERVKCIENSRKCQNICGVSLLVKEKMQLHG